MVESTTFTTTS